MDQSMKLKLILAFLCITCIFDTHFIVSKPTTKQTSHVSSVPTPTSNNNAQTTVQQLEAIRSQLINTENILRNLTAITQPGNTTVITPPSNTTVITPPSNANIVLSLKKKAIEHFFQAYKGLSQRAIKEKFTAQQNNYNTIQNIAITDKFTAKKSLKEKAIREQFNTQTNNHAA
jgi:hypothetical protein